MKSLALIDGANFYNFSKRLAPSVHLTNFLYKDFVKMLTKEKNIDIVYYVGEVRRLKSNKKSFKLYNNQQALFLNLRAQNIKIKLGYLLADKTGKYSEKGVDVQIAVDMVYGALKGNYNKFYLFSSDSDLLPAIKIARDKKTPVVYVSFKNHLSQALYRNTNKTITINKEMLENYGF